MQVSIDNDELEKKVAIALKGINGRSLAQAILKCIIIKAEGDEILLESTNLELGFRVRVEGIVQKEGICAIDGKTFADIAKKMPEGKVKITSDDTTIEISRKKVKIKVPGADPDNFPGLPELQDMEDTCSVSQGMLKDALNGVLFSVSEMEGNPMLSVVNMKCGNGQIRLIGLDGHRIAVRALEAETKDMEANLPGSSLKEMVRLLGNVDEKVNLSVTEHLACFQMTDIWASMRLVDGSYFEMSKILQDKSTMTVRLNKTQLKDSVSRALLLLAERIQKPLIIYISEKKVELKAATTMGEMAETIAAETKGCSERFKIGFNPRYLMEILQVVDDEEIELGLAGEKAPCFMKGLDYLYVVLPISLNSKEGAL